MSRVLVIGATGQLGNAIMNAQHSGGIELVAPSREESDITSQAHIESMLNKYKPTHVINCAAYLDTMGAESNPGLCFKLNAQAVYQLAMECNKIDAELIQISTDLVFGEEDHKNFTEKSKTSPINIYGLSKVASEQLASKANKYKIIRLAGLFGLIPSRAKGSFLFKVLQNLKDGKVTKVYDHHTVSLSYTEDVADRLLWLLEPPAEFPFFVDAVNNNKIFHLVNEGSTSWYKFAREAASYFPGFKDGLYIKSEEEEIAERKIMTRPAYSALTNTVLPPLPHWTHAVQRFVKKQKVI